ncbi:MAG: hypothetical protein IPL65_09000 [Lewinellaceae bacterium]|nr:hypothetical protein [Lewinellaceae bacterium]
MADQSPLGLVLVGMGACFIVEAGFFKHSGAALWEWVAAGTAALVVFILEVKWFANAHLSSVLLAAL